ncbi:DUF2497 domain-containing protein [Devosia sp.]|uniref:DUF2497 domain-containing protein n=1 Tax=Devosia sp. TaxID=1871048 RepID=UPI0025C6EA24|nr:DUF2497 domain-containing protein [Devosia sp.]
MNKPAAKEPSMDEILSSIRQIIADDDESAAPRRPSLQVAADPMEAAPAVSLDHEDETLALSSAQIVPESEAAADMGFEALLADAQAETAEADEEEAATLVVPDDIGFAPAEPAANAVELPSFDPAPAVAELPEFVAEPEFTPEPEVEAAPVLSAVSIDEDRSVTEIESETTTYARPSLASASPMPDATLSADIAEGLLETTTKAAVRDSIGKLGAAGIGVLASPSLGNANLTIEAMVREMLRPMLKEWLDENLPSVVERMVEKEIARVARGE